ncbi:rho GTPase-activating protein 20-like isoform X3 [Sphaeramia orbicularis]|uniref:rho GTPase-activating protein 20-like isoform X3 n=1 Tax=Sphaeramia orbicularis TaxID=375764 RepID=UPI00117C8551|nr:rho GTPase-activating protein 20-like isoform X3 [Sphaeramia orbicularis]
MDNMSPQQQQQQQPQPPDGLSRGAPQENKRRLKSQSYRRQSAPSLVITKALTRSKTISRESFLVPVCPETCPLIQSFLTGAERSFLLHGHAQLKTGLQTQDRHLFMFTDILVIAKAKSANHFKQKAQVCVCEMWTAGCLDEVCEGSTNPDRSFVMGWPTYNCVAMFSSAEQKEKWLSLLKSRIKDEKEKEEPKTIPLRVYGKGINTFALTKTLPVSNSDSTNEVVRLALQQFGIIGNVKDYQLWVVSKRDNAPYPLIGHEFPFSIQMSHVRASQGSREAAASEDRARAMQVEQLQVSKQCQFILKPRPVQTVQQPVTTELSRKPFKRRRSLITWAFWKGSSSQLNEMSLAGPRGCLFSQPLSRVCVEDTLPKPVTDMLSFLYHEGSWTKGIFRRPAGARAVRELRDSLDAGDFQLPLTRDHVFVIAGVFKDFLRSIPGSLLCSELHEEWMDVLEEEDEEEEQVQDVKRMICRLPRENALLLRHLLAMLHGIQGNAQENQMTSFNLSVCIAPSMLWPPGAPSSPEVEGEGTRKVCELVKFMIEHWQQIFGEDPSLLFGGPPQRLNTEEMGSGTQLYSWQYPLTDSSYDSVENELDNSSGGSPNFCSRRTRLCHKPLQGSLDSILTFSDYDLDTDPDTRHKLKLGRTRGRRLDPDMGLCCPGQDAPSLDTSSTLDSLSLDGLNSLRRRSEPAVAYMSQLQPHISRSADGLTCDDGEKEVSKKASSHTPSNIQSWRSRGVKSAALEASSSSLSSTPVSPAPTRSSLDSLDSLSSDHTWAIRRGLHPNKSPVPSATSSSLPVPSSTSATPFTVSPTWNSGEYPDQTVVLKDSPPKDQVSWGTLKGLHPNSWLKKDRRLSLTQQENLEKEEDDNSGGGTTDKPLAFGKVTPKPGEKAGGKRISSCQTKARRASKDGNVEQKPSSPGLFYKQRGPTLSLFKRHKSQEEECMVRLYQRRGSEPGQQLVERASSLRRARLPSDPGLKVSEVDSQGGTTEGRFCLSPYATKAVKDYFSSHSHSNPQSSQQVALALVEGHREWLMRCSEVTGEPDFEQLLLAEESYV